MPIDFPNTPSHGTTVEYNGVKYTFRKDGLAVGYWQVLWPGSVGGISSADYAKASLKKNWPTISNNAVDSVNDIDFTDGIILDSVGDFVMEPAAMTKRLDAIWSAGTGNGGRAASVSLVANMTIHCFVIAQDDGTADFGFDDNADATGLLDATWTRAKWVGALVLDGAVGIRQFQQEGDSFIWEQTINDLGTTSNHTSAQFRALTVPKDDRIFADINVRGIGGGVNGSSSIQISAVRQPDVSASLHNTQVTRGHNETTLENCVNYIIPVDSLGRIRVRCTSSTYDYAIKTKGWQVDRGEM